MTERIHLFDIIKGFCICLVIITHFPWQDAVRTTLYYHYLIEMAVPMFMMVSGYLYAASMERKKTDSFEKAYSFEAMMPQLVRYTIPYMVIFAIFTGYCVYKHYYMSFATKLIEFVTGDVGPGGYYFPLLIQLIFVFPVIYFVMKKNPDKGIITVLAMNVVYEFLQRTYNMDGEFYRLLVFRYMLHIGFGTYVYLKKEEISRVLLIGSLVVGLFYMYVISYTGYQPKILRYWTTTSFVTAFYCFPLFYLAVRYLKNAKCWPLEVVGRASYHIFLVQALYYGFGYNFVNGYVSGKPAMFFVTLAICLLLGIGFRLVERPIGNRVVGLLKNIKF